MSIERQKGRIIWVCDACGDHLETDTSDFQEAREAMRAEGWFSRLNPDDDWEHYCNDRVCRDKR